MFNNYYHWWVQMVRQGKRADSYPKWKKDWDYWEYLMKMPYADYCRRIDKFYALFGLAPYGYTISSHKRGLFWDDRRTL